MGTFTIKSSTLNDAYEYKASSIVVNGNYTKDAESGKLQNISGSCYRADQQGNQGEYIGNFNGSPRNDDEIYYSLSEMSRRDSNLVWDAIDEIEGNIINNDEEV